MPGTPLTSKLGAIFIQENGPNTQPVFQGCTDADTLTAAGGGIDTLRRCFKTDGTGWNTLAATRTPDEVVTTTLTAQIDGTQSMLTRIAESGDFASMFINVRESGFANDPANYVESYVLGQFIVGERGITNAVMREDEQFGEKSFAIGALPPYFETYKRTTARQSTAEAEAINDIAIYGTGKNRNKLGFAVADAATGVTANVYRTRNQGGTWTVCAADPFAADEHITSLVAFEYGANSERVLVARGSTDAGNPAEIAYSDDNGATWSTVDVGSTNGQFAQGPHSLFALDPYNIFFVTDGGYIYKSTDLGATWTTLEAGVATTEDLTAIHMASDSVGYAVAANGVVLKTQDGGSSWSAVTAITSTPNLTDVHVHDADNAWVSTATGLMYYTEDGGTTWNARTFAGSGGGSIASLTFTSLMFGYLLHNPAAGQAYVYTTKDGGYTWEVASTLANSGFNGIAAVDHNTAFYAGEAHSSLGYIGKVFVAS